MATYEFKLPEMGEGVMEGEIVRWLVKEGDPVGEDQPLLEVMTDKATVTVPSPRKGRVLRTHGKEGEMARVHELLVTLDVEGEGGLELPVSQRRAGDTAGGTAPARAVAPALKPESKVLATPVTRRMAREHGLDLADISGSGPQGRVTKADVEAALQRPMNGAYSAKAAVVPLPGGREDERIPLKGLRKRIAEKMVRSKFSAPHFTFVEEVDVTELVALRHRLNGELEAAGETTKLNFLPFICKALIPALRSHPSLNATFDEATQELVVRGAFHFGVAVATEDGLTVPVVKDVDRRSLRDLAEEINRLSAGARDRHLPLEDLTGGTFTITSLGQSGGLMATPIINHPEVAILGVHRIKQRPAVVKGEIVIRDMMNVSLSFDHRVIDGAVGAAFTYALVRFLEHPEWLFLEMM
jgi:pyruvate dehydrogenase E2 component (dihydrolipoamide acetyltransferase)